MGCCCILYHSLFDRQTFASRSCSHPLPTLFLSALSHFLQFFFHLPFLYHPLHLPFTLSTLFRRLCLHYFSCSYLFVSPPSSLPVMSDFISSSPTSTSFSISVLEHKIANVEQEIKQVEIEIKTTEMELKNCTAEEKQDCRDKLQRLGEEKKQLRKKEEQLREEKNLLLQQQLSFGKG